MNQWNGQIVMEVLHKLNKPSTLNDVLQYIVDHYENNNKDEIRSIVRNILRKGVANGFLWKINRKYATYDVYRQIQEHHDEVICEHLFARYIS